MCIETPFSRLYLSTSTRMYTTSCTKGEEWRIVYKIFAVVVECGSGLKLRKVRSKSSIILLPFLCDESNPFLLIFLSKNMTRRQVFIQKHYHKKLILIFF